MFSKKVVTAMSDMLGVVFIVGVWIDAVNVEDWFGNYVLLPYATVMLVFLIGSLGIESYVKKYFQRRRLHKDLDENSALMLAWEDILYKEYYGEDEESRQHIENLRYERDELLKELNELDAPSRVTMGGQTKVGKGG